MNPPITAELSPYIPGRRPGRGTCLQVRQLDDDAIEVVTVIPGNGSKQGGTLTPEELFRLSERLRALAVFAMHNRWEAVPAFAVSGGRPA